MNCDKKCKKCPECNCSDKVKCGECTSTECHIEKNVSDEEKAK